MNLKEAKKIVAEAVRNNATKLTLNSRDDSEKLSDEDIAELMPDILKLKELQYLDLTGNKLTTFNKEFAQLDKLRTLYLIKNNLIEFDKELAKLKNLRDLILTYNQIVIFDKEFAKLENLRELGLGGNQLTEFDKEFSKLKNLKSLNLWENQLIRFDKEFAKLENLTWLSLKDNSLPFPNEILEDESNPQKILNYIVEYYEAQEKGNLRPLNEAKLVVVGEANVGKTCLINRLIDNKFIKTSSTHGIEIHRWTGVELEDGAKVQLNVWDFGGQEIMHSTHQFFFTKRTVYILVINARENQENNKTEEWLQRIRNLSQNSPVFVVGNKIDENNRGTDKTSIGYFDINRTNLTDKFPELIKGFYGISSDVGQAQFDFLFEDFKRALIAEIGKLKEIHEQFPANWFEIKAQLEKMREDKIPYIKFNDYIARCVKAAIENEQSQRTLIDFMHDLGIALSFQDDRELRDLAVLNPEWVTRGVYALIDNAQITLEKGILKREDLGKYLNEQEYPPGETQDFIVKMMRKFRLLVDIEKDKIFLLPDLLPKDEPDTGNWQNVLHFQYGYEIYEKSILRSFIVEMYPMRSKETYWRNGIVLIKGTNRALVRADVLKKHITVKIEGNPNTRREFLAVIRREFDKIHGKFDSLDVKEKVGHPKYPEILRDYDRLLKMEENGVEMEFVEELEIILPVKDWLDGVESVEERNKNREKRRFEEREEDYKAIAPVNLPAKVKDDSSAIPDNGKREVESLENELREFNREKAFLDEQAKKNGKLYIRPYLAGFALAVLTILGVSIYLGFTLIGVIITALLFLIPLLVSHFTGKDWTFTKATEQKIEAERKKLYQNLNIDEREREIIRKLETAKKI